MLAPNPTLGCVIIFLGCVEVSPSGTLTSPNRDTNTHYPNDFDSCHIIPGEVHYMSYTLHTYTLHTYTLHTYTVYYTLHNPYSYFTFNCSLERDRSKYICSIKYVSLSL